jgi:hypothetical protein
MAVIPACYRLHRGLRLTHAAAEDRIADTIISDRKIVGTSIVYLRHLIVDHTHIRRAARARSADSDTTQTKW